MTASEYVNPTPEYVKIARRLKHARREIEQALTLYEAALTEIPVERRRAIRERLGNIANIADEGLEYLDGNRPRPPRS